MTHKHTYSIPSADDQNDARCIECGQLQPMTQPAKHTPGPWYPHYAKADHCLSSSVWGREPGNQVAVIGGKSLETMNANAALIAAAPAMYEAIRKVIEHRAKDYLDNDAEPYYSLAAALAQAEGSKP